MIIIKYLNALFSVFALRLELLSHVARMYRSTRPGCREYIGNMHAQLVLVTMYYLLAPFRCINIYMYACMYVQSNVIIWQFFLIVQN